ncbi:MAG: Na+/H+ antiporter NhaA [Acidimicrobiales bacterium]
MRLAANRRPRPIARALSPVRDFLAAEAGGGALLVAAAAVALVWANSPWRAAYSELWGAELGLRLGGWRLEHDLRHWVNDGAMTVFFLVVGLEIKRELTAGSLAGRRAALLPAAAALGGMVVPAAIYLAVAGRSAPGGWGVPMATDIALAVGVLALAGPRASPELRVFLLGLAVVDDIGAIAVIALFYSEGVGLAALGAAAAALVAVLVLRWRDVQATPAYVLAGGALWLSLNEAHIHPTLAGVAMGLLTPSSPRAAPDLFDAEETPELDELHTARAAVARAKGTVSVVEWLEHVLHPWSSYVIVPVFALANAGLVLSAERFSDAVQGAVFWGIVLGLLVGKPLGVLVATRSGARLGLFDGPPGPGRARLGVGAAAGIGFTVALFVSELAFTGEAVREEAKLAILLASVASAALSLGLLRGGRSRRA